MAVVVANVVSAEHGERDGVGRRFPGGRGRLPETKRPMSDLQFFSHGVLQRPHPDRAFPSCTSSPLRFMVPLLALRTLR